MSPRGLTIALLASAAVNVFLIGAAAGLMASNAFAPGGAAGQPANPLRAVAERLDPPNREALLQVMQDQVEASGPVLLDARKARREARRLMMAQPFDQAATLAALARARSDDVQVRTQLEGAVVAFAAQLSPQQRSILSSGLMRPSAPRGPLRRGFLARLGLAPRPSPPPNPAPGHG
ncbi:MAG: periplasmic heavy metal sensor [Caulobacteraceae bacterium]|nr:periplasmic heavy metal sensor [Caulobacteraceae bacterium]